MKKGQRATPAAAAKVVPNSQPRLPPPQPPPRPPPALNMKEVAGALPLVQTQGTR